MTVAAAPDRLDGSGPVPLPLPPGLTVPRPDFTSPRLYVEQPLAENGSVPLDRDQAHYLGTVLRLPQGATILAFNGRDGEWRATLTGAKSAAALQLVERSRPQPTAGDVHYCFAPAETCPSRLSGPEGRRDGGERAPAGDDPAHPGGARQPRAYAQQRDRSRRAMRRAQRARGTGPGAVFGPAGRMAAGPPDGVLRRGCRGR